MQITIRGHHLSITPAIEDTIRCKFAEMTKHIDQVNSMQVKLTKDHQFSDLELTQEQLKITSPPFRRPSTLACT
jgi:ribosomal subunit interface protein